MTSPHSSDPTAQRNKIILAISLSFLMVIGIIYLFTLEKPIGENIKPISEYGGNFTLNSADGVIDLRDLQGKVVVAYFGFLNCTEACPLSMATISKAIKKLTPEEKKHVQFLFVSVDPKRDNLADLDKFAKYYDKDLIMGLTGSQEQVKQVAEQYGVFFDLVDMEGSDLGYTVDHSSRFYMIDQNGDLVTSMSHSTSAIELAAKIKEMLSNPPANVQAVASSSQQSADDNTVVASRVTTGNHLHQDANKAQTFLPSTLKVENAYIKLPIPGQSVTAAFATFTNISDKPISIQSANTPIAEHSEFHEMTMEDERMQMRQIANPKIKAGQSWQLTPGGDHMMLMGLKKELKAGNVIPIYVTLADGQTLTVEAQVKSSAHAAEHDHNHMNHDNHSSHDTMEQDKHVHQ